MTRTGARRVIVAAMLVAGVCFLAARRAEAGGGCDVGDAEDCSARCANNDHESCGILGAMLAAGRGIGKDADKARALLEKACADHSTRACVDVAMLSETGIGVPKDEARARAVYERSCLKDRYPYGCIRLAGIYETGHGVAIDLAKAEEMYEHACDAGDARGCTQIGRLHEAGKGMAQDLVKAEEHYKTACDHKDPAGCASLAHLYERKDPPKAMALYQLACDRHYWLACTRLGFIYASGPMDLVHGIPLYQRACDHFELDACTNLGMLYGSGNGIAQDANKAKALYQRACDGGNATACKNLKEPIPVVASSGGEQTPDPTRSTGRSGTPVDPQAPVQDESACDKLEGASAGACYNTVALAYEKGWTVKQKRKAGLKQDRPKAAQLYTKACDLGDPNGCINLGSALYLGTALPRDMPKGLKMLHRSCYKDKLDAACTYLKTLPAWAQDGKLVKALPEWATDGPIEPVDDGVATGPGCDGFWKEKHTDSPKVAKMKGGADLALARLKEAKRPDTVSVEIWKGCATLWEKYVRANRAKIDREAREAEAEEAAEAARPQRRSGKQLGNGVSCTFGSDCASDNCTFKVCKSSSGGKQLGNGIACTFSSDCESGDCTFKVCRARSGGKQLANGVACTFSSDCESGDCTFKVCRNR